MLLHLHIIKVLPAGMGNMVRANVATPKVSINSMSTECPQLSVMYLVSSMGYTTVFTDNRSICHHYRHHGVCRCHYHLKMEVRGVSTIFATVCEVIRKGYIR